MMIDDLDGALEMDDDGPLMEISYGDGPSMTLMMCWMMMVESMMMVMMYDGDGGAHVGDGHTCSS